jgi:hypothetical protein
VKNPAKLVTQPPAPDHPYAHALSEALSALGRYETHGNGTFIWQAYAQARLALLAFPAWRKEQCLYLRSKQPKWNVTEARIKDDVVRELMEQILKHIDAIARDLLEIRGTSSPAGAAKLRKSLRMQEDLNPVMATGRETEEKIIDEFLFQMKALSLRQNQFKDKVPPADAVTWNFTRVRDNVARALGVSGKHAGETIGRMLEQNTEYQAGIDEIFAFAKTLKPKAPPRKQVVKKKAKSSNANHIWRSRKQLS